VLDADCGTGEHTLMAASLARDATGIDLSFTALCAAERKARERCLPARFLRWDALRLAELGESFATLLDCGLFHIFGDHDRTAYTRSLRSALAHGGRFLMLCISDAQPPGAWEAGTPGEPWRDHSLVCQRVAGRLDRARHHRHHRQPGRDPGLAGRPHQDLSPGGPEREHDADR